MAQLKQNAYLLVHTLAVYNDEYYSDYTDECDQANPAALYLNQAEAEAAAVARTKAALPGANYHDLLLGERATFLLLDLNSEGSPFDPALTDIVKQWFDDGEALPEGLTDQQLDSLIQHLDIQLYHVLEGESEPEQIAEAQKLLTQTPERPGITFDEDEETDELSIHFAQDEDTPEVQRLNRITELFGRRYAAELMP